MRRVMTLLAFLAFLPATASAMSFGGSDDAGELFEDGKEAAMDGDFDTAIDKLKDVVDEEPKNADAWNLLGYSYRNSGEMDLAWDAYERALAIDPEHKGAHAYLGEWYLKQGDLDSAKAQLAKLEMLCPSGCEEREALEDSLAETGSGS